MSFCALTKLRRCLGRAKCPSPRAVEVTRSEAIGCSCRSLRMFRFTVTNWTKLHWLSVDAQFCPLMSVSASPTLPSGGRKILNDCLPNFSFFLLSLPKFWKMKQKKKWFGKTSCIWKREGLESRPTKYSALSGRWRVRIHFVECTAEWNTPVVGINFTWRFAGLCVCLCVSLPSWRSKKAQFSSLFCERTIRQTLIGLHSGLRCIIDGGDSSKRRSFCTRIFKVGDVSVIENATKWATRWYHSGVYML